MNRSSSALWIIVFMALTGRIRITRSQPDKNIPTQDHTLSSDEQVFDVSGTSPEDTDPSRVSEILKTMAINGEKQMPQTSDFAGSSSTGSTFFMFKIKFFFHYFIPVIIYSILRRLLLFRRIN